MTMPGFNAGATGNINNSTVLLTTSWFASPLEDAIILKYLRATLVHEFGHMYHRHEFYQYIVMATLPIARMAIGLYENNTLKPDPNVEKKLSFVKSLNPLSTTSLKAQQRAALKTFLKPSSADQTYGRWILECLIPEIAKERTPETFPLAPDNTFQKLNESRENTINDLQQIASKLYWRSLPIFVLSRLFISRQQELQADAYAAKYINPDDLADTLAFIFEQSTTIPDITEAQKNQQAILLKMLKLITDAGLSTHPSTEDRIARLRKMAIAQRAAAETHSLA